MEATQQRPTTNSLIDRQERLMAAMLTRFKNLVKLATAPVDQGAAKETAAAQAFQMEMETAGLVSAAQDILQLTRELKELWLFGPLRAIGEGEAEGSIDEDSKLVGEKVDELLKKMSGIHDNNSREGSEEVSLVII